MALTDKLTAIGNAIRTKTGKSGTIKLDEMPNEILGITSGKEQVLYPSDVLEYMRPEMLEVIDNVQNVRKDDSIIFVALSDSHYPASQGTSGDALETIKSAKQATITAKTLAYMLSADFFAHTGDVSWGASNTTVDVLKEQIEEFNAYFVEASSGLPCFMAIGNHDSGIYYHESQNDGTVHTLSGEYLYNNFTKYAESEDTVIDGEEYGGYCYRDFADKKLRVFLLNTSEYLAYNQTDNATLGSQRVWLANALIDLNSKVDASDWGFIILCHYPADYGATMPLSQLFKAYVEGGSITITTETNTSSTINFSGHNSAKFIAQFHGHVHNFKTDKLSVVSNSVATPYDAKRICIPNGQFNRENYYGVFGGINFAEDVPYEKTADSANGTSYVVNVINPSEELIYSFCYGAGTNRVISYGSTVYYSITKSLTNVNISNNVVSVESGKSYTASLSIGNDYSYDSIKITMGGEDITSTAISSAGVISIGQVTGDIVITATASRTMTGTNLVPTAINSSGASAPYTDGIYINSSGVTSTLAGFTTTGFIPVDGNANHTYRIGGNGIGTDTEYTRIAWYNSDFSLKSSVFPYKNYSSNIYNPTIIEDTDAVLAISTTNNVSGCSGAAYFRICTKGNGANLIVTVDEPFYGGAQSTNWSITKNLTNAASSNSASSVSKNGSYTTTITPTTGYEINYVKINMGGIDVTSTTYNTNTGVVNISSVTGNVVIIATAILIPSSGYTNQIPISLASAGGTTVYNGIGYKTGTRINSSFTELAATGMCCTGYIPVKSGDIIRIKNVTISGNSTAYGLYYTSSGDASGSVQPEGLTGATSNGITTLTVPTEQNKDYSYFRLSVGVIDDTSIITVNQEIE